MAIVLAGSYAYVALVYEGLSIIDVSTPTAPIEVARLIRPDGPMTWLSQFVCLRGRLLDKPGFARL